MQGLPRTAQLGLIALLLLITTLGSNYLLGPAGRLKQIVPDQVQPGLVFGAHPAANDQYLIKLGDSRQLYARVQWQDFPIGILFAFAFTCILLWFASTLPPDARWPRLLVAFPVLAGLADVTENALMLRAINAFPALSPSLLPWATSVKLACIFLTFIAVAGLGAIAFRLRQLDPVPQATP